MNTIFKSISLSVINAMIVMTLILSPIPFSGNSNVAFAADEESQANDGDGDDLVSAEEGCDEGSEDDRGNKRYKAGCEFNEDLATTDLENHYPDGIVGIIEQFVGAIFALIGITLFWKPIPNALVECPQHLGAKVSFPAIQIGCLSYLTGEISANLEFKKGSKVAVDKTFEDKKDESYDRKNKSKEEREKSREVSKKNRDKNNKQIAAYDSLEKIYGHQVSGLKKKIMFATAAEVAFITAEVFETFDIVSNMATAETTVTTQLGANLTAVGVLDALAVEIGAASLGICTPLTLGIEAYTKAINAYDAATKLQAEAQTAAQEVETETQAAKAVSALTPASFIALGAGGVVGTVGVHTKEVIVEETFAVENDAQNVEFKATRAGMITAIETEMGICLTGLIEAEVASLGISAAVMAAAQAAIPLVPGAIGVIETTRAMPIFCSGSDTVKGVDLDTPLPTLSSLAIKIDAAFPEADVAQIDKIKSEKNLFYVKNILHNFFYRLGMHKVESKKYQTAEIRVREIAATSQFVDFQVEEAMKQIKNTDFEKEIELFENQFKDHKLELADNVLAMVSDFKFQMVKAAEANAFKELLNIGIKVVVLYFVVGKWLRNNAFPKPRNRIITWAIMAVVNAAIIKFDMDSKSEAEERVSRVKEEKRKFLESHAIKTKHNKSNETTGGEGATVTLEDTSQQNGGGSGILSCAVPKGDGFAPAVCPTVIPKSRFQINSQGANFSINGSPLKDALNGIGNVGYGVATGQQYSEPSLLQGNVATLSSKRDGLIKQRDKLRKKLKTIDSKNNKGKTKGKGFGITALTTKFKKHYSGDASKTGVTGKMASMLSSGKIPKINLNDLKKFKKKTAYKRKAFPKFNMPTAPKSDFDFDLGGEGGTTIEDEGTTVKTGKGEENLSEFVVNSGEINEDENVNIFKLISNRYLMSYPVLLNEKKKNK
jgi:hypothetical protein